MSIKDIRDSRIHKPSFPLIGTTLLTCYLPARLAAKAYPRKFA